MDVSGCGRAASPDFSEVSKASACGRAKFPAVNAGLLRNGAGGCEQTLGGVLGEDVELLIPAFPFYSDALRDRRSFWKDTAEFRIVPARRKMDQAVGVKIRIHQAGQRREWQIRAVDRVRDEKRIARRQFDRPEIVEFDYETIIVEKWRSPDLDAIVVIDRRTRKVSELPGHRNVADPAELAVLHLEVSGQGHQKAERHRIDKWRAFLDGHHFHVRDRAEAMLWQGLEPVRQPPNGGDRPRQDLLHLARA